MGRTDSQASESNPSQPKPQKTEALSWVASRNCPPLKKAALTEVTPRPGAAVCHGWSHQQLPRAVGSRVPVGAKHPAVTDTPHHSPPVSSDCSSLCDPVGCSPPGSSVHGISQARIMERVAIPFSKVIILTQGSNPGFLLCRQILYSLSHEGCLSSLALFIATQYSFGRSQNFHHPCVTQQVAVHQG